MPNRADGYTRDEAVPGAWRSNLFDNQFRGSPAGGGYSTIDDLSTFITALGDGRLLSPRMHTTATTGQILERRFFHNRLIAVVEAMDEPQA